MVQKLWCDHDSEKGHVRVYDYSNGSWTQVGGDISGSGDKSGWSLAMSYDGTELLLVLY